MIVQSGILEDKTVRREASLVPKVSCRGLKSGCNPHVEIEPRRTVIFSERPRNWRKK